MTEKATLRQVALMRVPVMRVRKMWMRVSDRIVPMPVGVSHAGHHRMRMLVLMMLVVHM